MVGNVGMSSEIPKEPPGCRAHSLISYLSDFLLVLSVGMNLGVPLKESTRNCFSGVPHSLLSGSKTCWKSLSFCTVDAGSSILVVKPGASFLQLVTLRHFQLLFLVWFIWLPIHWKGH